MTEIPEFLPESLIVTVEADIRPFKSAMREMTLQSQQFGNAFSSSLRSAIVSGRSFESTLKTLALQMSSMALSAAIRPLGNAASGVFGSIFSSIAGGFQNSKGNMLNASGVLPFASGGVVAQPTFFQAGGSLGVMGEAGAEAILPLARGRDGRLGVRASSQSGGGDIIFNVSTPDPASFKRSEGQITAMLTRAVGRGRRSL